MHTHSRTAFKHKLRLKQHSWFKCTTVFVRAYSRLHGACVCVFGEMSECRTDSPLSLNSDGPDFKHSVFLVHWTPRFLISALDSGLSVIPLTLRVHYKTRFDITAVMATAALHDKLYLSLSKLYFYRHVLNDIVLP